MARSSLALGVCFVFGATALALVGCSSEIREQTGTTNDALACTTACVSGDLNGDALLTPVNRTRGLRSDWAPATQALPAHYFINAQQYLRPEAADAFVRMVKRAYDEGVDLYCSSGYRSFNTQCSLFASYASNEGCEAANTYSANAGHSEHQLGTVCDIALGTQNGSFLSAGDAGDIWLTAHAHEYGFANSYPHANASQNDGYIHEPWHYRYIGIAAATALKARGTIAVPVFIASLTEDERAAFESGTSPDPEPGGEPGEGPGEGPGEDPCRGFDEVGTCTGAVLEWCENGVYKRVDCSTKTDGRIRCGADPNPALGNNCIN